MAWVLNFIFDAVGGRALLGAGALAALFAWWQIDGALDAARYRNEGANNAISGYNTSVAEIIDRARQARDGVDAGDPHERLRRHWCTDCRD